jgi:YesN/AraC family two-component response regulator
MKLLENMNILIVEDEDLIRETLCSLVERLGASEVFRAENGILALKLLKEKKIDLIL